MSRTGWRFLFADRQLLQRTHRKLAAAAAAVAITGLDDHAAINDTAAVGAEDLHVGQQWLNPARYCNRRHQGPGGRMASHSLDCPLPLSQESDAPEQTPTSGCAPSRSRLARPVRSPQHQQPASCGSKDSPPTAVVITHPESGEGPDKCSPSDEIHTPDRRQAPVRKARSCDPPARRRRRRRSRTSRRPGPRKSSAGAPGRGDPRARPCPGFGAWDDRGFALDAVKSQAGRVID
jgi:hypothetical protein